MKLVSTASSDNIQVLRAGACLSVVLFHCSGWITKICGINAEVLEFGALGVDLFFCISGFIIVTSTFYKKQRPVAFLLNRTSRIIPLYWIATFVSFAFGYLSHTETNRASLADLAKSLFMIPFSWPDGQIHPIHGVGWTLEYEMFFYAWFGAFLLFGLRTRVVAVTLLFFAFIVGGAISHPTSAFLIKFAEPTMVEFLYGVGIGFFFIQMREAPSRSGLIALFGLASLVLSIAVFRWDVLGYYRFLLAGLPLAIVFFGAALCSRRLDWMWAVKIGDASYSIYLFHGFPIIVLGKLVSIGIWPSGIVAALAFTLAAVALSLCVGLLTYRWIERPMTVLIRSRPFPTGSRLEHGNPSIG